MSGQETVSFERATAVGWIRAEGIKVGPLAVATYTDDGLYRYVEVFHIATGMTFARKLGQYPSTQKDAVKLAKKVAAFPEWLAIKRKGKKPGNVTLSKKSAKALAEKILKAWGGQ